VLVSGKTFRLTQSESGTKPFWPLRATDWAASVLGRALNTYGVSTGNAAATGTANRSRKW
jgi:hypothetical protein